MDTAAKAYMPTGKAIVIEAGAVAALIRALQAAQNPAGQAA